MMQYTWKHFSIFAAILFCSLVSFAGDSTGVTLTYETKRLNEKEAVLKIKATIEKGVKLFSITRITEDAPASTIYFDSSIQKFLAGPVAEIGKIISEKDTVLGLNVSYYLDSVYWEQKLDLTGLDSVLLKATITAFVKKGEEYLPGEEQLRVWVPGSGETITPSVNPKGPGPEAGKSLWVIFIGGLGAGLLAVLSPCIFSMIPITVSFFTKRSRTRKEGIKNALLYSLSIISIFTLLGFLITLLFGTTALNNLATNWIANIFFFLVFVLFGVSFLGAFEINLPSSWTNNADKKANTNNFTGIFFMALTLVLVSFSCTMPNIGLLLPLIGQGSYLAPLIGFFGFSLALALPFALFAFFPSMLNKIGKAGGWLNTIKVTLGFIELALALKFLSNADLARGWRLLDREIYLSLWIVIFLLLGIYLLGKIKFHHDDELPKNDFGLPYLAVTRLFFAMASLSFTVYMIPGLWGAPLNGISAFLPPMGTQDFILGGPGRGNSSSETTASYLPKPKKYYDRMHIFEPEVVKKYGMIAYFDFNEAQEVAKNLKKPLMLDFTGINCVNCRKMEAEVWSNAEVMKRLKEDFVIASLYIDVHNINIPDNEQYQSTSQGNHIETLGDLNTDIQVTKFGANSQPYYFFLDQKGERLRAEGYGYDPSVQKFIALLDEVKAEYKKRNP